MHKEMTKKKTTHGKWVQNTNRQYTEKTPEWLVSKHMKKMFNLSANGKNVKKTTQRSQTHTRTRLVEIYRTLMIPTIVEDAVG